MDILCTPLAVLEHEVDWAAVPVRLVPLGAIVCSQRHLDLQGLIENDRDDRPCWGHRLADGRVRLNNGHHRYARAVLRNRAALFVRVVEP